jgi:hypothetical protein
MIQQSERIGHKSGVSYSTEPRAVPATHRQIVRDAPEMLGEPSEHEDEGPPGRGDAGNEE